jgi:hypothetical protein
MKVACDGLLAAAITMRPGCFEYWLSGPTRTSPPPFQRPASLMSAALNDDSFANANGEQPCHQ